MLSCYKMLWVCSKYAAHISEKPYFTGFHSFPNENYKLTEYADNRGSVLNLEIGVRMSQKTINITGVSLCKKEGRIRIFHSTIKRLGEPKYIRFLFNPEKQLFAVQASDRKRFRVFLCVKMW